MSTTMTTDLRRMTTGMDSPIEWGVGVSILAGHSEEWIPTRNRHDDGDREIAERTIPKGERMRRLVQRFRAPQEWYDEE